MKSFFALKGGQDKKASEQESSHFGKQERSQSPSLAQVYHPAKQTHVTWSQSTLKLGLIYPPGGGGYSHTLPRRVCAAQRGRDFEAPDLERGTHFRGVF